MPTLGRGQSNFGTESLNYINGELISFSNDNLMLQGHNMNCTTDIELQTGLVKPTYIEIRFDRLSSLELEILGIENRAPEFDGNTLETPPPIPCPDNSSEVSLWVYPLPQILDYEGNLITF